MVARYNYAHEESPLADPLASCQRDGTQAARSRLAGSKHFTFSACMPATKSGRHNNT